MAERIRRGTVSETTRAEPSGAESSTELSGFYRLPLAERRPRLCEHLGLDPSDLDRLGDPAHPSVQSADFLVENAIGVLSVPLGVCLNLRVDAIERVVPMAIEEPSVIAAASHASKLLRAGGGVVTETTAPVMEGQIQLVSVPDPDRAEAEIRAASEELVETANRGHPRLVGAGGGARAIVTRRLERGEDDPLPPMLVAQILVDVRDAMGANAVNSMCERVAPALETLSGGRARLRVLTNLCHHRRVTASGSIPIAALGGQGDDLARGVVEASVFAERDPQRAATHNKGIMNGVDAALLAFGQDWRAAEAGAHAYAARGGRYGPLATWRVCDGELRGSLTLPLAVGVVGGATRAHPNVGAILRVARISDAASMAGVVAAVGLAQNLGALRALAGEGIQSGHLRLHARHVCAEAGAEGREIDEVARVLATRRSVNVEAARDALRAIRGPAQPGPGTTGRGTRADGAAADLAPVDDDLAYCAQVLPKVSRTFTLSIESLPFRLREPVCVSYLLCRIVDTVEDEPRLGSPARTSLFDAFEHLLRDETSSPARFEALCGHFEGGLSPKEDVDLCRNASRVFRAFRALPRRQIDTVRDRVLEMSRGMRRYCAERDRDGRLRFADAPGLERYCYFVAGTVGELLTGLFENHVGELPGRIRAAIRERAIPFGLGLQMVNVLKDAGDDLERGVCFMPEDVMRANGVTADQLLDPDHRDRALEVVRRVGERARVHLDRAREYTLLWPGDHAAPVRLFCAVPLSLAYATLREIARGDDTLRPGRTPKVSREEVSGLLARAPEAAATAESLARMIEDYAR